MALKAVVTKDEHAALAEPLKALYVEENGKFVLDADIESHPKVGGLKSALEKERKAKGDVDSEFKKLKDRVGDIDPEKAREALAKMEAMAAKELLDKGQIEEFVKAKTEAMQTAHATQVKAFETQIKERDTKLGTISGRLKKLTIDSAIKALALEKGVKPEAIEDAVARFTVTGIDGVIWDLDGENVVAKTGDQIKYGKDPSKSMSFEEGFEVLTTKAPHLFAPSGGGGARPAGGGGGGSFVLTAEQAKNTDVYRATRDAAAKAGQQVQIQG